MEQFLDIDTPEEDITISIETVALFAEECIKYVLNFKNIVWHPPISFENLRKYSTADLFTAEIGRALSEQHMIGISNVVANMAGFSVNAWLQMPLDGARSYVKVCFLWYTFVQPSGRFEQLLLWAFACDLCYQAVTHGKRIFVSHVLAQLVEIMYSSFNKMKHYEGLHEKATLWNRSRFDINNRDPDEGIDTGSDEDNNSLHSDSD